MEATTYESRICSVCHHTVKSNQKAIFCNVCLCWVHQRCAKLSNVEYGQLSTNTDPWFCSPCLENIFPFNKLTQESDFILFTSNSSGRCIDYQHSESLVFRPFVSDQVDDNKFLLNEVDLDPDINYYNGVPLPNSQYTTSTDLNDIRSKVDCSKCISLLHVNCRSIVKNFDTMLTTVTIMKPQPPLIAVSEIWTTEDNEDLFNISGYKLIAKSRIHKRGGGVGIYVSLDYNYKLRDDLLCTDVFADTVFIELIPDNVVIGCVYKPPDGDVTQFTAYFDTVLTKINKEKKTCYIAGDFNIDLIKFDVHTPTTDFVNCIFSHAFMPTVNKPTRVTEYTATLIDNIITNVNLSNSLSAIIYADVSEHFPVFLQTALTIEPIAKPQFVYRRNFSDIAKNRFLDMLQHVDWSQYTDVQALDDNSYDSFIDNFVDVFNDCYPLTKYNTKHKKTPRKPWMTSGIVRCCNKKEKLFKAFKKNHTEASEIKYKKYRNKLNKIIKCTQNDYYKLQFQSCTANIKKTWQVIKNILNKSKGPALVDSFKSNGNIISDKREVANKFNEYFANIGPSLAKKIPKNTISHSSFLNGNYKTSFSVFPTTPEEIICTVNNMKSKKSAGYDNISIETIKLAVPIIAEPLSLLINHSFTHGKVPDSIKIARVCPVYKNGDNCEFTNYRPISILPSFSKIFEKLMYTRLTDYLTKYAVLSSNQYGFRTKHDTSMAVIEMVDKISDAIDNREYAIGIFIDLSKAFDTLDHHVLFDKLEHYGIRGVALNWFKSYLNNRVQFVDYNDCQSQRLPTKCGVPQGSILGPILFLLYINDVTNVSKLLNLILFADDTNIFMHHTDMNTLVTLVNVELSKLTDWFVSNRLSLNVKKTNFIIFCSSQKHYNSKEVIIILNGNKIEQISHTKFLGVYIDEHLNWEEHIKQIGSKVSKSIGVLWKLKSSLTCKLLLLVYNCLILPYFTYCNLIWSNACATRMEKLLVLQKKIIRMISKAEYLAHTDPIFKQLSLLKIADIGQQQISIFVYKFLKNELPVTFNEYFCSISEVHNYFTRQSTGLHVKYARTNIRQKSLQIKGPHVWNKLPPYVTQSISLPIFKKQLKRYFLSLY